MTTKLCKGLDNLLATENDQLYYLPNFFTKEISDHYLRRLKREIAWEQGYVKIFGKQIREPRLSAWYGDHGASYTYSGIKRHPKIWEPLLIEIKQKLEEFCQASFNSVLLNYYRHGDDSMGWHRDNERELGKNPLIASLSFGEERNFLVREYQNPSHKIDLALAHGSLVIMAGEMQEHWQHAVPKRKKCSGERFNLTFRKIH